MNLLSAFRRLLRNRSGVAMTEFALGAPLLLTAGLWGTEEANYALVNLKISQLAIHMADNASRVGDTSTLQNRKVYEGDINDVIYGAELQAGPLELFEHGRVTISSLEVTTPPAGGEGNQYIHWQRCRGAAKYDSSFGKEGDGLVKAIDGMGQPGQEVYAQPGEAVIFVELVYDYQPMISARFIPVHSIHAIAAFTVRDKRDLAQLYQRDPADPDQVQSCSSYRGTPEVSSSGKIT